MTVTSEMTDLLILGVAFVVIGLAAMTKELWRARRERDFWKRENAAWYSGEYFINWDLAEARKRQSRSREPRP